MKTSWVHAGQEGPLPLPEGQDTPIISHLSNTDHVERDEEK